MQKHKKRKTCKKSNKIKKITFAPAISSSYLLKNLTIVAKALKIYQTKWKKREKILSNN